jgi:hypothetical protein
MTDGNGASRSPEPPMSHGDDGDGLVLTFSSWLWETYQSKQVKQLECTEA